MKKQYQAKTIRLTEQEKEAVAAIKQFYGLSTDNEAIRFALTKVLREIQQSAPLLPQRRNAHSSPT